jgi:lipid II:glycine glycyltransferase (peptidoglycan interpeptide bridge formation enzyme)
LIFKNKEIGKEMFKKEIPKKLVDAYISQLGMAEKISEEMSKNFRKLRKVLIKKSEKDTLKAMEIIDRLEKLAKAFHNKINDIFGDLFVVASADEVIIELLQRIPEEERAKIKKVSVEIEKRLKEEMSK